MADTPKKRGRPRIYASPGARRAAKNRRSREFVRDMESRGFVRVSVYVPRSARKEIEQLAAIKREQAEQARKLAPPREKAAASFITEEEKAEAVRLWREGYGLADFTMSGLPLDHALKHLVEIGDIGSTHEGMRELTNRDGKGPLAFMTRR